MDADPKGVTVNEDARNTFDKVFKKEVLPLPEGPWITFRELKDIGTGRFSQRRRSVEGKGIDKEEIEKPKDSIWIGRTELIG